ncbi:hypothetical protein KIJ96_21050 (plasmid) [Pseudoalteromonas piscicida]|uniref:hypothetical protein n=1 Tax=Pseudoalteromonas piscicida TaxID=43662 RepID=UPI001D0B9B98|nr:hypothetical protein [Pseudoalteromonas piscicida]UDM63451.1 hypothetical protein KIJ96_21050 [Pseudoalteromonas piscicida]
MSNCKDWFICFLLVLVGSTISSWNKLIEVNGLISCFSLVLAFLAFKNARQVRSDNEKYKLLDLKRETTKGFAELISAWNDAKIIVERSQTIKNEYSDFVCKASKTANSAYEEFVKKRDNLTIDEVFEYLIRLDYKRIQMRDDVERMGIRTELILDLENRAKTSQQGGFFRRNPKQKL